MKPEIKQALESIKPLARGYKAVMDLAAALEQVGDLDNLRLEVERRLAEVRVQIKDAEKARDVALSAADSHRTAAAYVVADAKENAVRERAGAQAAAEKSLAQAEKDAAGIVDKAKSAAREAAIKAENEAQSIVQGAMRAKADMDALRDQVERALAGVRSELAQKSEELATVETKLTAARERVAELLK